jgi:CBS domain-containing protein
MMMLQNNVRHLLVVDNDEKSSLNKPVGRITPRNFKKSWT